jgi:hypothetical protein
MEHLNVNIQDTSASGSLILEDFDTSKSPEVKKSSDLQSLMNSVKIFFGNVYLTIPNVFEQSGILGGIILYISIAAMNAYTMNT